MYEYEEKFLVPTTEYLKNHKKVVSCGQSCVHSIYDLPCSGNIMVIGSGQVDKVKLSGHDHMAKRVVRVVVTTPPMEGVTT